MQISLYLFMWEIILVWASEDSNEARRPLILTFRSLLWLRVLWGLLQKFNEFNFQERIVKSPVKVWIKAIEWE